MTSQDDWDGAPDLQSQPVSNSHQEDVTRALPHALGPEKSLLSTMLQDPQEFIGVAIEENLTKGHFYLPNHATLFGFLSELFEAGQEIEFVSMIQTLIDRGLLERVGGASGLTDLYTYAPASGHFRHHLKLVKDKFMLRAMIQHSNETIAAAYDQPEEVAELLDRQEAAFLSIRNTTETAREVSVKATVNEIIEDMQDRMAGKEQSLGLSTGFEGLDELGVRLKPAEVFVIAARPSMGKTSLMMNIAEHLAIGLGLRGLAFSMEMTKKQLVERLVYSRAKANPRDFKAGYQSNKGELDRLKRAAIDISSSKILIDDREGLSIGQVRAAARRKHSEDKLHWIAIDYLQLMKSTTKQAENSREREVSQISAGVKGLAKELGIPIILLAQLNRGPESRSGKSLGVPRMSDLRESGSIEQDADIIGLLYREAYYAQDDDAKDAAAGIAELIIAKNRNGATGNVPLTFIADLMRFENGPPAQEEGRSQNNQPQSRFDDWEN